MKDKTTVRKSSISIEDFIARFDHVVSLADLHLVPNLPGNYLFVNMASGTTYNGSSIDLQARASQHIKGSHNKHLARSIKHHGVENLLFCYSLCSEDDLINIEQTHLDFGFSSGLAGYCNIAEKAGGGDLGEEVNAKRAAWWTEERRAAVSGENNPMSGKTHTPESRAKMSESRTGKYCGDKNSMYGRTGEKNPMYGKNHSPEALAKMCDATIHTFQHKDGRIETCTQWALRTKYNLDKSNLSKVVSGRRGYKSTGGWSLAVNETLDTSYLLYQPTEE